MNIADNMEAITDAARKIVESENTNSHQSTIKWQKGEPKDEGRYLVTTIYGHVATAVKVKDDLHYKQFFNEYVIAWCKLSDIEPYKEEKQ